MNTTLTLKNKTLKATFKTKGAELIGLTNGKVEYIWKGDPVFWGKHSPVLFPIVGELKNNSFFYQNNQYHLCKHGFARDMEFTVLKHNKETIVFDLKQDTKTRVNYPFDFSFQIIYLLNNNTLTVSYKVHNPSEKDLYFSVGAHPAFSCPFENHQKREEYQLVFDTLDTPKSNSIQNGLRNGNQFNIFQEKGKLNISKNLFDNDALVFSPNPFSEITFLHTPTNKRYLKVRFPNFPYLGIWSKNKDAPFICIEPWYGINDTIDHNQKLERKEGILKLASLKTFHSEYTIQTL